MESTVKTFPIIIVIDGDEQEYIGSGKSEVDKVYRPNSSKYSHDNQTLVVESSFSGEATIQQLMKQYLIEQKFKIELDGLPDNNYNEPSSIAVVTSTKEGNK